MSNQRPSLDESYQWCRITARRAGSSFYPCFFLLPRAKRRAMCALYAFLRHTDDLGDNSAPLETRRRWLAQWRTRLAAALEGRFDPPLPETSGQQPPPSCGPDAGRAILLALSDTVRQYQIPHEHLHAVIEGVEMDLDFHGRRYETFAQLEQYCHHVASAVGLACIRIWGCRSQEAVEPAIQCGVALQLTNILRDLKEDALAGRVYLPLEDLRRCEYSETDLLAGRVNPQFLRLMDLEIERARDYYRQSASLIEYLEPDGRRIFGMMTATYCRLLDQIDRRKHDVLTRRIRLTHWQTLLLAARWFLWPPAQARAIPPR